MPDRKTAGREAISFSVRYLFITQCLKRKVKRNQDTNMPTKKKLGSVKEKKTKAVSSPKPKLDYHLEVHVNDEVYKGDAETLLQAFKDFVNSPAFPTSIKTKVFIKYGKVGEENQKLLHVPRARAIFTRMSFDSSRIDLFVEKLMQEIG